MEENNNIISYLLGFIILVLLSICTYFYTYYEFISKSDLQNKYTKNYQITFDSLPFYVKSLYIKQEDCKTDDNSNFTNQKEILNEKIKTYELKYANEKSKLNNKIEQLKDTIIVLNNKIKNLNNDILKSKDEKVVIKKEKTFINNKIEISKNRNKKFNSYKTKMCTDMPNEKVLFTKSCLNNIKTFANENKNSLYFEVMGLLNIDEYKHNNKLKTKLSQKRALLATNKLKNIINNKVFKVNYNITSKKQYRGIIIRAYY